MLRDANLSAPDGFRQLRKGVSYHFLANIPHSQSVVLAFFEWAGQGQPRSHLMTMSRDEFEEGLSLGMILVSKDGQKKPPWLAPLGDKNFAKVDAERVKPKKSYREYIDARLVHIQRALDNLDEIFSADDVESAINASARRCTPPQNETRFRTWLVTYLCFGQDVWALLPPFHLSGHWDRETGATKKQGPPSKAFGEGYGHKMTHEMRKRCVEGYKKFVSLGKTMTHIYADAMNHIFRCKTFTGSSGAKEFYHPNGEPFPSFGQFRYEVVKQFGIEIVQLNRYGAARYRRTLAPSLGRFSEDVAYLLEKIEFDAYSVKERPKGYLEGSVLDPLYVVRARDVLSGAVCGIGFSLGAEREEAYLMALFSMAVPKEYFCSLLGIHLEPDSWVTEGLAPHYKVDRGAGSSEEMIAPNHRPPVRQMTPAYAAQSKATVESSHPRDVASEGQPHYVASNLTPVGLARREVHALIQYNDRADMSARMPMDRELAFLLPTPNEVWKYYAGKFRTVGYSMTIPDAVRTFLKPADLIAKRDGIYLRDLRYDSKRLRASGLLNRVARLHPQEMHIQGYVMNFCVRHVWAEVDHELMRLDAQLPIREDEELLFVSVAELNQWNQARQTVASAMRVHSVASFAESLDRFEKESGERWDSGIRKAGRVKKTAATRQETLEASPRVSRRKSA